MTNEGGPIILIGAARSGTKFLRDVIAAGDGTAAVPYDVNYVWRYGNEKHPHDALTVEQLAERNARFIRKALPSLARQSQSDILVEKTVSNTLRVPFVDAVYPEARFVHLIRDGRDVVESAMRQWEAPPDWAALRQKLRDIPLENLGYVWWFGMNFLSGLLSKRQGGKIWGPRYAGIDQDLNQLSLPEICAAQWAHSVERASADLAKLPKSRVHTIYYEDLVAGQEALSELLVALNLPDRDTILAAHAQKLRKPSRSRWTEIPAEDRARIMSTIGPALVANGYEDIGNE